MGNREGRVGDRLVWGIGKGGLGIGCVRDRDGRVWEGRVGDRDGRVRGKVGDREG